MEFASILALKNEKINISIDGLGGNETNAKYKIKTMIFNKNSSFSEYIDYLVIPQIIDFVLFTILSIDNINISDSALVVSNSGFL